MKVEMKAITPEYAEFLLNGNQRNRRVSQNNVDFLAKEMEEGRFKYNGDTIRVDTGGFLIDGQHRLLAIVKSKTTQMMAIATGLDPEVFMTIDQGRKRTAGDILDTSRLCESNPSGYAAAARMLLLLDENRLQGKGRGSNGRHHLMIEHFDKNKAVLTEGMHYSNRGAFRRLATPAMVVSAFAHYAKEDISLAREFFEDALRLQPESKTVALLKDRLVENQISSTKLPPIAVQSLILKALRKFFDGQDIARLRYQAEEPLNYARHNRGVEQ